MTETLLPPKEMIQRLLAGMTQHDASDLHIKVGYQPFYRITAHLRRLDMPAFPDTAYVEAMLLPLMPESLQQEFARRGALDFSPPRTDWRPLPFQYISRDGRSSCLCSSGPQHGSRF